MLFDFTLPPVFLFATINCTQPPFPVKNNDLGMFNWTAVEGVDPRPYATAIKYFCPRDNWAYPSTGFNEVMVYCLKDGTWSNQFNIETCQSKRGHQIQRLTTFPQRCSVLTSPPRPLRVRAPKGFLGWK